MATSTKSSRLNLRLTAADDELIRQAAAQAGESVSDFLTVPALERAHEILADQLAFVLDEATWDQFVALLDEPVRPDARLVELFSRPARIVR